MAFTPDGRLLVTTQPGVLQVVQDGALLATPALSLGAKVCTESERGLLGVAVDPAFASNHFIYLYYTAAGGSGCVNRVSRFVLSDSNVVALASETVLLDNIPSPAGNHNGGDLHFGKDGYLYVSVGDGGCDYAGDSGCAAQNDAARDLNVLLGKVLRITSNGGIPADNPFLGANSARCNLTGRTDPGKICQETFAWGLRNPFRLAFDPNASGTRFYINDVGQGIWEEVDAGQAGADYGWNVREGFCATGSTTDCGPPPAGMTNPIFAYAHADGCNAITAGAFVPNGVWPAPYEGSYLFADYLCGKIWRLVPSASGFTAAEFATDLGVGGPITMIFGPSGETQALYYATYANGGEIRRITLTQQNHAPTGAIQADVTSGPAPLTVQFDGSTSADPDLGDTLTYIWNFGDGTPATETTTATTSHVYATAGTYTASLTVRDNHGTTSAPATVQIQVAGVNQAPTANLAADVTSGPAPLTVQLDGGGSADPDVGDTLTYIWDFGDGTPATETTAATTSHVYATVGSYTASLTVRDNHGATSEAATLQIQVTAPNQAPTAKIAADTTSGQAPLTVQLDGSASSDPDPGDTLTYIWDFGDGTPATETTTATTSHVYATVGTYTASLTVRDNHGTNSAPATVQIQVENRAPTANLAADLTSGPAPLTVQLDGTASSDPDPGDTLTYIWDFGDGTSATETTTATTSHVYATAGTYTASLTVRDNHGATSEPARLEIQVGSPLIAPQNVAPPAITGLVRVGNVLTAGTGTWTGSEPFEFSYQWLRCDRDGIFCLPITGATDAKYTLVEEDFGATIRVVVTATNAAGSAIATSLPTARVKHECGGDSCTA